MLIKETSQLQAALEYHARGWCPIPIPHRAKAPTMKGWQQLHLSKEQIERVFSVGQLNIGVLLGEPSGWLVDVDLDHPLAVRLAPAFLPPTDAVFGRPGKPRSHWLYVAVGAKTQKFKLPSKSEDKNTIVELRSTGAQTVFPPSIHESGEPIVWETEGEPAIVVAEHLARSVKRLAAAVALAFTWPDKGSRHDAALALGGVLARAGWDEEAAEDFVRVVALAAGDDEPDDRARAVRDSVIRYRAGETVTGIPRLLEFLPNEVVAQALEWLGINEAPRSTAAALGEVVTPLDGLFGGGELLDAEGKKPRYVVRRGRIEAGKLEGRGDNRLVVYYPLSNFAARIVREVMHTDGVEAIRFFELAGYLDDGSKLPRARVKADEFAGMNWVAREWGSRAIVTPGHGAKDQLRAAIQYMSNPEVSTVYAHMGWAEIEGKWVYLHANGGIGPDGAAPGIEVELGRILEGFALPAPPEGTNEREYTRAVLELLKVAPPRVVWPLLLYTLAAPLGWSPFTLYLAGPTGARKTSLALVAQSFFGYRADHPPIGWEATANALEGAAFAAKDALLLVDDFAPTGHEWQQNELKAKAARLLREQGNATGRARMRADGSMAGSRPPRGSLLVTGEDLPPGHSVRARSLIIELRRGDVDLDVLTKLQKAARAGTFAKSMSAWVRYLASGLPRSLEWLQERVVELRPAWRADHGRTTDALARLHAVWELWRDYAMRIGALTAAEANAWEASMHKAFLEIAAAQAEYQRDANPVERFMHLLSAVLQSGRAHLVNADVPDEPPSEAARWGWRKSVTTGNDGRTLERWEPQGPAIGWVLKNPNSEGLFLDPEAAYATLNALARENGEPLPTARTLWKRLAEHGLIGRQEEGGEVRYQVKASIAGKRLRVIHVLNFPGDN